MRLKEKKILQKFAAILKKFSAQGAKNVDYGIMLKCLCAGQGPDRRAILYVDRPCFLTFILTDMQFLGIAVSAHFSSRHYASHKASELNLVEFANSVDPDEVAHDEPSLLDLCCLPSNL